MKKWHFVALLLVCATILGATVLREPIASAAQAVSANITGPLDAQGNVKVHEEGTAATRSANDEVSIYQDLPVDSEGNGCAVDHNIYTVPAGKTLVVEYLAGTTGASATSADLASGYVLDSSGVVATLPLIYQKDHAGVSFSASTSVHFAFAAGTTLLFIGKIQTTSAPDHCDFTIALGGYLQPNS